MITINRIYMKVKSGIVIQKKCKRNTFLSENINCFEILSFLYT